MKNKLILIMIFTIATLGISATKDDKNTKVESRYFYDKYVDKYLNGDYDHYIDGHPGYYGYGYSYSAYTIIKSISSLTYEQKLEIIEIQKAQRDDERANATAQRDRKKKQRYQEYNNGSFDRNILVQNAIENTTISTNKKADNIINLLNVLTDEQKTEFYKKIEDLKAKL